MADKAPAFSPGWGGQEKGAKPCTDSSATSTWAGSSHCTVCCPHSSTGAGVLQLGAPCSALPTPAAGELHPCGVGCVVLGELGVQTGVQRSEFNPEKDSLSQGWGQPGGAERLAGRRHSLVLPVCTFPVAVAVAGRCWRGHPGWTDNWSDTVAIWMSMSTSRPSNALSDMCFSVPLFCFHVLESGLAVGSSALLVPSPLCFALTALCCAAAPCPALAAGHKRPAVIHSQPGTVLASLQTTGRQRCSW